jgi:peroxiredoxin
MRENNNRVVFILFFFVASLLLDSAALGAESITALGNVVQSNPADGTTIPVIELPMPKREKDKGYLGLSGSGNFKIGQIKARALIIEVFSFYCPHCQRMASQVNDLYQEIQKRGDLTGKIKMIGIGAKNSAYEVDSYRERYAVPFPLFPDEGLEITEKLCTKGTPTFIGIKLDGKGNQERFYFGEGGFQDTRKFLREIIRSSGLK